MFYDTASNAHGLRHDPMKAIVAPRPIGWISTISRDGVTNLAPYSFFNMVAENPPYVMFSSYGRKDSQRNAEETGEFVCSLATYELREAMNVSSAGVGPEVNEFELAGLATAPSRLVKPPRVAASPAALECRYWKTISPPSRSSHPYSMVIGEVVGVHIDDRFLTDGMVDTVAMHPIARMGYMDYSVVDGKFVLRRPG
jgi:flavin reductase (DIM6/NTAB) family NADH-FMN oxidoreductase RutF